MREVLPLSGFGDETMSDIVKQIAQRLRVADGRCPNGHSLMTKEKTLDGQPAIKLRVTFGGHTGTIYLNPFYGKFEYESDIQLERGAVVDLSCPTCGVSLKVDDYCNICNIPMFAVHLPDGGQVEACPTVGCHKHSLTIVDFDQQLERMYVDEETKVQM